MLQNIPENSKITPEQFVYWLQGALEFGKFTDLNAEQVQMLKDHLALVFDKQTPDYEITRVTYDETRPEKEPSPHYFDIPKVTCTNQPTSDSGHFIC